MPEVEKLIEAFETYWVLMKEAKKFERAERLFAREKMTALYLDEINQLPKHQSLAIDKLSYAKVALMYTGSSIEFI